MKAKKTDIIIEYYLAQVRSFVDGVWSRWFLLGKGSLKDAQHALKLTQDFGGSRNPGMEYRIQRFVGTTETIE